MINEDKEYTGLYLQDIRNGGIGAYTGGGWSDNKAQLSVPFGKTKPRGFLDKHSRLHDTTYAYYPDGPFRYAADDIYNDSVKSHGLLEEVAGFAVTYGNRTRQSDVGYQLYKDYKPYFKQQVMDLYSRDPQVGNPDYNPFLSGGGGEIKNKNSNMQNTFGGFQNFSGKVPIFNPYATVSSQPFTSQPTGSLASKLNFAIPDAKSTQIPLAEPKRAPVLIGEPQPAAADRSIPNIGMDPNREADFGYRINDEKFRNPRRNPFHRGRKKNKIYIYR